MFKSISLIAFVSLSVSSAFASTDYKCKAAKDNSNTDEVKITVISPTEVKVNDADEGKLDSTYKPRSNNTNYVRMNGNYPTLGDGKEGYSVTLLVSKSMMFNEKSGSIKIFASGEGFFNDYFTCYSK